MRFKTMRLTTIRNEPKRTIFASGWLGLLQIVSEPNTGRCVSKDARLPSRGVNYEIPHGKRNIPYKGVETSPQ